MRHVYQQAKSQDYGVNLCEGCLQKQQKIDRLEEEVKSLKQKLKVRERKEKEGYFGLSTPSSKQPVKASSSEEEKNKQGGAKPGHKGNGRKSFTSLQVEDVITLRARQLCPKCRCGLRQKGYQNRSVLDIDPVYIKEKLYRLEKKQCPSCNRNFVANIGDVLPRSMLSNQLISQIADSHYLQGIPLSRICAGFSLNLGTVIDALHRVGNLIKPVMEELKKEYRKTEVRHADETTWRCDGGNGYCWLFSTESVSLYLYRATRSSSVVREVFGNKKVKGYLVVDRYAAYNSSNCRLQYCFAHLVRDLKEEAANFSDDMEVESFTNQMIDSLSEAMRLQSKKLADKQYYREAKKIHLEIVKICKAAAHHLAVRRWQDFFIEQTDRLYNWVTDRRVACHNNMAERELRPTVIARKVSFGSQAEEGAKTREIWMSVLHSLKKRVKNPRQRVKEVLDKIVLNPKCNLTKALLSEDSSP